MRSEYINAVYQGQEFRVSAHTRTGSEHLVLFLHGLGCAKESFDGAFTAPGLRDYSLCALDFVGFGASDKPDDFSYKLEDQAGVVQKVVEKLAPRKISLVAHSLGGMIGLLLTPRLPNLAHFINVEGNFVAEDCGLISRNTAKQSLAQFQKQGFPDFLRMLMSSDRPDFNSWATWYRKASPKAVHLSARSMVKWSDSGKLLSIFNNLPNKTYVYGDEEPKDYLLPRFEGVDVRYLPKLKHFMMIEEPKVFFNVISETLSR